MKMKTRQQVLWGYFPRFILYAQGLWGKRRKKQEQLYGLNKQILTHNYTAKNSEKQICSFLENEDFFPQNEHFFLSNWRIIRRFERENEHFERKISFFEKRTDFFWGFFAVYGSAF